MLGTPESQWGALSQQRVSESVTAITAFILSALFQNESSTALQLWPSPDLSQGKMQRWASVGFRNNNSRKVLSSRIQAAQKEVKLLVTQPDTHTHTRCCLTLFRSDQQVHSRDQQPHPLFSLLIHSCWIKAWVSVREGTLKWFFFFLNQQLWALGWKVGVDWSFHSHPARIQNDEVCIRTDISLRPIGSKQGERKWAWAADWLVTAATL